MNQYRLLRSNKESGPYTAAQLIELGLKPYDLVWLDGRSAAWRYPCEIDEFKPYAPAVEEQPFDRFFKKPGVAKVNATTAVAEPPLQTFTATTVKPPKPRIRIKADWNQVGQPLTETIETVATTPAPTEQQVKQPPSTGTPWQNAWLDWQQEQQAIDNLSKKTEKKTVNPVTEQKNQQLIEPAIRKLPTGNETREASYPAAAQTAGSYTRAGQTAPNEHKAVAKDNAGLDEDNEFFKSFGHLKQRYADTLHKAKEQAAGWNKHKGIATLALLAIPVLGFSIWLGSTWHTGADAKKPAIAVTSIIPAVATDSVQQPANSTNIAQVGIAGNTASSRQAPTTPKKDAKEVIPDFEDNTEKKSAPEKVKKTAIPAHKQFVQPVQTVPAENKYAEKVQPQKFVAVQRPRAVAAPQQQRYAITQPVNNNPSGRNKVVNPALAPASASNTAANGYAANQNRQPEIPQQSAAPRKPTENAAPVFAHFTKHQKMEDFISVDADEPTSQSVQNMALNVENVTDAPVDQVVIDVQYYDSFGKFRSGQTIYVKNIPVNGTVKVKIPDNLQASKIKYRVSLVSVEQKGAYLVAE